MAAWALWALAMLGLPVIAWLDHLSRQAGRPDLAQLTLNATLVGPVLACVSAATVGAVLASRRPRHPVGWLLLVLGLLIAWSGVPPAYVAYLALAVTTVAVVVAAGSLVVRFRRARGVERQQLRWVASAAALAVLGAVVALGGLAVGSTAVVTWTISACFAVLPVAIGAAILRYRLYDPDRIVSRTLAYGLLTLLLGGGYAVVVLSLGQLLGRSSPLVVAGATLAVAALFQPAHRRIQQAVDRRFNRRRHDAAQTIAAFGTRLRDELDLDTLSAELLAVVDQTMQPTQASLWLRPSQPSSSPAGGPRAHPGWSKPEPRAG